MDDDLLVTNAFYPILSVKDTGTTQKGNVEYNYYRDTKKPYLMENLGPYPEIKLTKDVYYDERTNSDFKSYLKKKNKVQQEQSYLPSKTSSFTQNQSNTQITQGTDGQFSSGLSVVPRDYTKKDFGNDLLKYSQNEEGFDDKNVNRLVRDTIYTVNIDSRWRDDAFILFNSITNQYTYETQSTDPDSYVITLPQPIRNIKMVEIKSSEFPYCYPCVDTTLANSPPVQWYYILLSIDELNNLTNSGSVIVNPSLSSKNDKAISFFTKIQLNGAPPTQVGSSYTVNSILYNCHIPFTSVYTNALQEVTKLTIKFLMPNGSKYPMINHSFTLEFITYTDSTSVTEISTRRGATDITVFNKILK